MSFDALRAAVGDELGLIDSALASLLAARSEPTAHYGMLRYHLGFADEKFVPAQGLSRGKRIRPLLSALVGAAVGAPREPLVLVMLANELLHAASLIHDDIQDADPQRWSRPTLWSLFGIEQAINAGDTLIFIVQEVLGELPKAGLDSDHAWRIQREFTRHCLTLCEGQHLDLLYQGQRQVSPEQYLEMISKKTATACECATGTAALLGTKDPWIRSYSEFGLQMGRLYQIVDDHNGIWCDSDLTGKEPLQDILLRKSSLPLLRGLEVGPTWLRDLLAGPPPVSDERRRIPSARLRPRHMDRADAERVKAALDELEVPAWCRAHAVKFRDLALDALRGGNVDHPSTSTLEAMVLACASLIGA